MSDQPEITRAELDVICERRRHPELGWTPEHDDEHANGEMATAAACYAQEASLRLNGCPPTPEPYDIWPWKHEDWHPADSRRMLVKAGALIVAEIERIDREATRDRAEVR